MEWTRPPPGREDVVGVVGNAPGASGREREIVRQARTRDRVVVRREGGRCRERLDRGGRERTREGRVLHDDDEHVRRRLRRSRWHELDRGLVRRRARRLGRRRVRRARSAPARGWR